jgi:LAO/AO transport system kinase
MCRNIENPVETFGCNAETTRNRFSIMEDLVREFLEGSVQAMARIITLAENEDPRFFELMRAIYPGTGKAYVVGITGAPGTGKSTLTDVVAALLRERKLTVGIIAVDPSSPFAGGALLGDRIRMQRLVLDPGVFIRSMATRGHLGGLARATSDVVKILDAFGKDFIIVETVGVGQDEVDIAKTADTTILVLAPGLGDAIQSMKAGVMEIADIYAINKADREGVDPLFSDVKTRADQDLDIRKDDWNTPVLRTAAIYNQGIAELVDAIEAHRRFLQKSGRMQKVRREKTRHEILRLLKEEIAQYVLDQVLGDHLFDALIDDIASRRKDPYTSVREIVRTLFPKHDRA